MGLTAAPLTTAEELIAAIDGCSPLAPSGIAAFVVFDADHTLWHADLGDLAFLAALEERRFRNEARDAIARELEASGGASQGDVHADARTFYERYKRDLTTEEACVRVMTLCYAGWTEAELRALGARLARDVLAPARYEPIERVARELAARGLGLKVVSGSPRALVEEGVRGWLPLDPARDVLGMELETSGGRYAATVRGPLTYAQGKVEAFAREVGATRPAVAFGDSKSDLPLLRFAARARIAVHPRPELLNAAKEEERFFVFAPPRTVSGQEVRASAVDRVIV